MTKKIKSANSSYYKQKLTRVQGAKAYTKLRAQVYGAGIIDREYWYYTFLSFMDIGGLLISLVLLFFVNHWTLVTLVSVAVGFFVVRIGGLLHDAGHRGIFKSPLINDIYGYILSFVIAFPYLAWKIKHNAHHAHTNEEDEDPDLDIPFQFLEEVPKKRDGFARWVHRYQSILYYPLGSLVSFSTRMNGFRTFGRERDVKFYSLAVAQVIALFCWYILPFLVFPLYKAGLFFVVNNIFTGFYLLNIFAPNHKGMPQIKKGLEYSFVEQQIITSRNITRNWLIDYLYLGLNYQIEHHLFVNCPRNKLNQIGPYVKDLCNQYKIPFLEMSAFDSNKFIVSELKKAEAYAR